MLKVFLLAKALLRAIADKDQDAVNRTIINLTNAVKLEEERIGNV